MYIILGGRWNSLFTVSGCGWVISFLVFYRRNLFHLVIYFSYLFIFLFYSLIIIIIICNSVVAERNCLLLDSCLDKFNLYSASSLVVSFFFFFSGLFPIWGVFQFWAFGLSSEICNLFIRHSVCTTVTSAGFSSGPRPVFPVGQPPLLRFSFVPLLAFCFSCVGWYNAMCVSPCVHRVKIGLETEEMEGERAASLFAYGHPSSF